MTSWRHGVKCCLNCKSFVIDPYRSGKGVCFAQYTPAKLNDKETAIISGPHYACVSTDGYCGCWKYCYGSDEADE